MYSNFNVSSSLNFVLVKYEIQEQDNTIPIEDCFSGPPSKPCLESIPVCRSPMYFGVGPSAWGVLRAVRPVAEHRGWKRKRSMEYLGYGRGYLLVRG